MDVLQKEVDFPRGGAGGTSSSRAKNASSHEENFKKDDQLFGSGKKRKSRSKSDVSSNAQSKKMKLEKFSVWSKPMSLDLLTEGVMGLGVVTEVHEDYVLLETADSCRVRLPATQVCRKFTELLKEECISLESSFVIGQMVPFIVTQRCKETAKKGQATKKKKSSSLPTVSCDPAKLNAHISPARLVPGLVLHAIVESTEEKGAVLDVGLQSVQGFLPTKSLRQPVRSGQPIIVRIESKKTSRIVVVTSFVEQDNLNMEACENLQLNHLMPGTILECEPDPEPSVSAGIYVNLGNGVRGFVAKSHLPPRLRTDISRLGRALRCVVMFCQQNTPLLVLSAHPDIIAISKVEKRISFSGYNIGDRINCTVIDVVPQTFLVCFSLPVADDGKVPLVTAIAYKKYLNKPEEIESFYSIGSEHTCRVMNFRYADRCVVVSTRKDMLSQKIVSYKDAKPGEIISAKITDIHPRGVQVSICETVKGFIPADLALDRAAALEKVFRVGSDIKCRVWFINDEKKQVWLTARQNLVNHKGAIISSYNPSCEGIITVGVVSKILSTGGALLQFFGTVRGLLPANEAKKLEGSLKLGQVLEVRVISVDSTEKKMTLGLVDVQGFVGHVLHPEKVDFCSNGNFVFSGVVSEVCESSSAGHKSERVLLHLDSNASVDGFLFPNLASDSLDSPCEMMRGVFYKGQKLTPLAALGALSGMRRFTSKRFVCTWLETFQSFIPMSFDDLKEGQFVCCIIIQRVPDECLYVEVAGGSGLIGKVAFADVDGGAECASDLQIGQTVIGRLRSIHAEKKTFRISLKLTDCVPNKKLLPIASTSPVSVALLLLKSSVEEICSFAGSSKAKLPQPGTIVTATVIQSVDDVLFVVFSGKSTGCVRRENHFENIKVGDKISCIVIDYVFPRNDAELVMIDDPDASEEKKKRKKEEKKGLGYRVVLVKRDYICLLSIVGKYLLFVPSRFHPNQVFVVKNARVSVGDMVEVEESFPLLNNVHIGLLHGDADLISKLMPVTKQATRKFSESKDVEESEPRDLTCKTKSDLGLRTKSIKNLGVYTGKVVGPWTSDDRNDHCKLAVKVELPGGNIGRLHVSELPSKFLSEHTFPLEEFVKRKCRKDVMVKIIDFTAIRTGTGKVRVAELTMSELKMSEARKKAKRVAFQTVFTPGSIVRCFMLPDQKGTTNGIRVEVNPFWSGIIAHEAVSDDLKIEAPERGGEVFECLPKTGEMRVAKVLGTVKKKKNHGHGLLNLAFDLQADNKNFEFGQLLTARVTHVSYSPLSVQFHLANGQRAILCATAIANNYEKVHIHIDSFQRNGIFRLYALRQERNPLRNFVVTEGRYESYLKQKENGITLDRRSLLSDRSQVEVGSLFDGFVVKHTPDAILVEIGPGIVGRLRKFSQPKISTIPLNSIVTVKVSKIDAEKRISLVLVGVVVEAVIAVRGRKRAAEEEETLVSKKKTELLPESDVESIPLHDPGFDWSNTGFLPEDLAAVGKLDDVAITDKENTAKEISPPEKQKSADEIKKTPAKEVKPTTKEELDMEKERRLIHREVELSGDLQPESQEDFARLLRKDPNCAELWIRYISFFLEKNDLTKARATAERALTVINYREEDEIFNLWTAYLNMEVAYGDEDTTKEVFKRACGNADSYKMHKQMAAIFFETGRNDEADEIYETMVKKFRANSDDVWTLYGEYLMATDRAEKARDLMKRAITSVPKQRHVPLISRFAQLEFRRGDFERGRTLFESLVTAYPKKTDVWLVYADMCVKHSGVEEARQVLERACALPLSMHKMRPLFRKWIEIERRYGDEETQLLIRKKARKFLSNSSDSEDVGED